MISISCNSRGANNNDVIPVIVQNNDLTPTITKEKDSIFFSFSSLCNFQLNILSNNNATLSINGKIRKGLITKNKYSKDFFDFVEKNKVLITFSVEDSNIIVENQKYQFDCEGAKFIMLNRVNNDNESLSLIKNFLEENTSVLNDNIEQINDKAYFLEKINQNKTAEFILEKITSNNPERVLAWLNLVDVYWKLNKKTQAKEKYEKYISLMKSQNKDLSKIPQRVKDRIK